MATSALKGIGLLGGTFDPIHLGHLRLAWEAYERLDLDHVCLIPCHLPPHRDHPSTPVADRLAMVEAACAHNPGFRIDTRELDRNHASYTIDTLESLRAELGPDIPLVFLMGMDAFCGLSGWYRYRDLLTHCHLWVAHRPGSRDPVAGSTEATLLADHGTDDAADLQCEPAGRILVQATVALDISATFVRREIAAGRSPRFLLPDTVYDYIQQHGLYRSPLTASSNQTQ